MGAISADFTYKNIIYSILTYTMNTFICICSDPIVVFVKWYSNLVSYFSCCWRRYDWGKILQFWFLTVKLPKNWFLTSFYRYFSCGKFETTNVFTRWSQRMIDGPRTRNKLSGFDMLSLYQNYFHSKFHIKLICGHFQFSGQRSLPWFTWRTFEPIAIQHLRNANNQ